MATIPDQQEPETTVRPSPISRWKDWKPTSLRMKEGFYVSGSFAKNPQVQQIHRGQTLNVLQPQQMEQIKNTYTPDPDVYWDNPVRVARYYNFLRAQPPGYQAPEWLDAQQVNAAYNYLKYKNNDKPWTEWKPLQQDDPGKEFIRNMPAPPNDMRFGQEPLRPDQPTTVQSSTSEPFGDWNKLDPWQQIMLGIFSPQPGLANRPESTRLTASAFQGVMAGLGGAAVGAAIAGLPGALIGGAAVGLGTTYQTYTGNEVPVLSQALMLFDLPAQWLEQGIGVGAQIATDGLDEVMQNLPAAWEAGQLTYETAQADLTNIVARIAGDTPAAADQVWQIQKGLSEPQKLQGERGTAALNAARERINKGEDITAVYLDYVERFGFTGTLNDFVGQSLLDPTQLAPFIEGRAGAAIADAAGNKRLAAAFRDTTGSAFIDVLPMGLKQLAEAVTGQHESAGLMGAIETYKNYIKTGYFPEGTTPLAPDALSGFEKRIAGLDEQGRIKELQPASGKGGVAGFVEYLNNLTPEAKANVFLDNLLDNMKFLLAEAKGDPDAMIDILNRAAGITPTQAGQAGERLIQSPYTATAAAAYYDFLKTGMTKELLAEWHAGDARRPLLEKIAKALDETPAEIIRQANDNIDVLARRVNERAPGLGEPNRIAEMLKPFTGDDAIPYDPVQFQAKLTNVMFDQAGDWLVKRFGIKQASAATRLTNILKSAQSMLLLNLNPGYFLNNTINNVATRAAVGVFGFMTPRQLDSFLSDFGITPERLSEGVTPTGEVAGRAGRVISDVVKGTDALANAQRIVSAVGDKIGVFSKASATVEGMESKQAYVIGMKKFYSKAWKRGKGFDRMGEALVNALERDAPGSSNAIYAAVEAGMNWKDIERAITGEIVKPAIGEILDEAAKTINPENPDAARELIDTTGVRQELETRLQNAETPQQAAAAFHAAEEKLQDFIDETFKREIVTRAEDVKSQVQKEGYPAALGLFTDLQVKIAMHWLQHLEDMENLFNKGQARAPGADMNEAISNSLQLAEREWKRLNSFELQTTAGILKAIGIESEAAGKFTDLMGQLHNGWKKFFEDRNARYHEVFSMKKNRGEDYASFQVRKNKAYRQASEQISRDFQKMAERENRLNENMSNVFAKAFEQSTKRSGDGAREWRKKVIDLRKQMQQEMTTFRSEIQGLDGDARRQAWADFQPRYRELVVRLKEIEIEGAHELARQPMSDTITKAMRDKLKDAGYDNAQIRNMTPEQINYELARVEGRETQDLTNPQAKAILDMAKAAGVVDKNGDPIPRYALNIINRRSETKYDDLAKVPLDLAQRAMDEHQRKHRHEAARKKIREIINARNILDMADADARENALRAEGLMSKRMVREMLTNEINATPEQVDAAIIAMDAHADTLTLNSGATPTEATRDAWYAQHWTNEQDNGGGSQLFQFEKPPASGDLHPWANIAKEHFGVTDNIREAGFILPDGTMLDLSGRHYASGFTKRGDRWVAEPGQRDYLRNQRDVDHRDLPEEIQAPPGTFEWQDNNTNTANMLYFLNQSGAVRIDYNSGMITIGAPITTAQASILSNWFSDGWIEVDSPTTGEQIWDQEFNGAKRTKMRSLLAEANDRIIAASGGRATEARIESLRQDFISGLTNYYEGNDGNPYRALDYAMGSIVELARQGKTPAQLQQLLTENGFGKLPAEKLMQGIRYARALAEDGNLRQGERGSISFLEDGRAILRGLQAPDVTTMMHEIGHVFRADLNDADTGAIAQWGGLRDGEELRDLTYQFRDGTIGDADRARYVAAEEKFAQGWEEYLARGDAPTPELRNIFQRFTDWFKQIYGDLKKKFGKVDIDATVAGVKISDVMDRMLTVKPNRTDALAQAVGPAAPPPPSRNPMHVAIADGKIADLPDHVSAGMKDVASWLEGEIARSKISLVTDADTGETTRIWEDGPYWYRQMLDKMIEDEKASGSKKVDAEVKAEAKAAGETVDEQIDSGNLKEKLISALKQIAKGKENPNLKRVQLAKGLIIDAALGNFGDLESRTTASLQWAWGDREGVFRDWGDNIYDEAWLNKEFGPEADDVLTEYLLWQSDQNPPQPQTTSAVEQVEAEWARNQEAAAKFEAGAPIPIDDLPAEITPGPAIGETPAIADARTRILEGLNAEEKAYALNVIDWLNNGGDEPATTLPLMRASEIFDRVAAEADNLSQESGPIPLSDSIDTNSDTIQAARVHAFEHGDNTIAAAIYHNGEVVALLPDNADVASTFETDAGPARLLGLDPDDPAKWVVDRNGKVESIDPERPELGARTDTNLKPLIDKISSEVARVIKRRNEAIRSGKRSTANVNVDRIAQEYNVPRSVVDLAAGAAILATLEGDVSVINKTVTDIVLGKMKNTERTTAPDTGALFQPGIDQTNTPEFKRWFGDSKVVDDNGNPLVVYHGTGQDFSEFDLSKVGNQTDTGMYGQGFYFSDNPEISSLYARNPQGGANVKPVYLSLQNPLIIRGEGDIPKMRELTTIEEMRNAAGIYSAEMRQYLIDHGYDGVISTIGKSYEYVALNPEQIKSTFNRGTYDPNNPNILYQPAADQPAPVMGEVPMGATPSPEPAGETLNEIGAEHVRPMLRKMQEEYTNRMTQAPYKWDSLSQETQAELRRYMNKVKDQQASTKYATMKYGEQMRDSALLNYSRRYGIDTYLNMVFPYQFWYTRSMVNWAKRMIDRPSWFAMYARMQQAQEKMEKNGMPTRLKGKMRMPAPWLPDWAGGGLWMDPASKLLPFATFGQPFEQYASDRNMIAKRAETILQDMVEADQITTGQMQEALRTRQGKAWEMATSQAQVELEKNGSPVNLVGMMMSPALYWSAPAALLEGKPEKISVMPITRTGQAIRTATQGTGLQGIGNFIGNALAMPEEKIRGAAGLSNFGEWGDYLIDRTLANMAADGTIDNDAARIAMIERQGPAYEEAYRRVEYEQMLRTPGAATLQQVAQGNIKGAAQSLPTVLLSGGLFPEGELKLRGLKGEYDKAWLDYKNGDEKALNNFFDAHPEYESRLALYTEPDDRLKKFLIGEVWDRYSSLEKTNRALASKELGATFRDAFLNSDTRSYDSIDVETLSMWAQQLGGQSPNTPETAGAMNTQVMDMYPPEFNQVIEDYQGARAEQFPNYYALQQEYYSLPEKSYQRRQFLKRFPELKDYWTWNRAYKEQHPEINQYYDDIYGDQPDTLSDQEFSRVDPVVMREVYFATLTGSDISTAVNRELTRLAKQSGMTVEEYQAALLATFAQSQMTQ